MNTNYNGGREMINTEIFTDEGINMYTCVNNVLELVNTLIRTHDIKKEDILEYHSECWEDKDIYARLNIKYHYKITISWWTEGENEHE